MKQSKHDVMRLLTIMFTIAAIGALSTSSMSAYAMSSPSVTSSPSPMLQSSPNNAIVLTTSIDGTAPHDDVRVSLAEPTVVIGWGASPPGTPATPNANPPPGGTCTLPSVQANPNARELWYFQSGAKI